MLQENGYFLVPDLISPKWRSQLIDSFTTDASDIPGSAVRTRGGKTYAVRNLLQSNAAVKALSTHRGLLDRITAVIGPNTRAVRAILFDKTPDANWKVAWHQDLSVAVKERRDDVPGYGPRSVKAGVHHVQPPARVLESMLTARIHLDDCLEDNGPLLVLPGSHRHGVLSPEAVREWRAKVQPVACTARAGDVLLMRPLLLHASSSATNPAHRRVVHIEFAATDLDGGLEWFVA